MKLKSITTFKFDSGTSFIVESPIEFERDDETFLKLFEEVCVDGRLFKPKGFGRFCLADPVRVGEEIEILV